MPGATVVIGENLVDLLVDATGAVDAVPGGGPFNVARTVARLGQPATFVSRLSADAFGRVLRQVLADDGVRLAFERPVDRPTALAVVDDAAVAPRYAFHLRDTAAFGITSEEGIGALRSLGDVGALYIGTLGLVVEPMATMVEDVVAELPGSAIVVLDPNCRPSATADPDAFRGRVDRLLPRSDIVKVSTEDLDYLLPRMARDDQVATLLERGAAVVVVTDGPDPVRVRSLDGQAAVDVPSRPVVDTVGAGDALVGGLLAWWTARGVTRAEAREIPILAEGLGVAVEVAAITCSRQGADPPRASELRIGNTAWPP
jgi:fructokinase